MELKRIRISNYKSITELSIDIKRLDGSSTVILVGKNGTGKTNILQAIGFLAKYDGEYDFQSLRNAHNDSLNAVNFYYTFHFESQSEWKDTIDNRIISPKEFFEKVDIKGIEKNIYLTSDSTHFKARFKFIFESPDNFLNKFCYRSISSNIASYEIVYEKDASKTDADSKDYKKLTYADFDKILNDVFSELIEQQNSISVSKWKYSKDNLITDVIDLNEFKQNCEICHPLKNIFNLAGFETQEEIKNKIESLDIDKNINKLEKILENTIKDHINNVWPECKVMLKIKIQDDLKLSVYVVDEGDEENTFYLTDRSEGFKQFISLILGMSAANATNNLKNRVLIIDEPETHMHPSGIRYMRDELLRIGRNNYVFLATHSEYIIDPRNKERHYIVTKVNNNTSIHRWENNNDEPNDETLRQAFGLNILSDLMEQYDLPVDNSDETYMYTKALKILYPNEQKAVKEDLNLEIEEEERKYKNRHFTDVFKGISRKTKDCVDKINSLDVSKIFSGKN